MAATKLEELLPRLIPVRLDRFIDERGFGFLTDGVGNEIFAHVSTLRVVDRSGRLQRGDTMVINDSCFGENPELYCIVGPGKEPGKFAAIVWVGTDISDE